MTGIEKVRHVREGGEGRGKRSWWESSDRLARSKKMQRDEHFCATDY